MLRKRGTLLAFATVAAIALVALLADYFSYDSLQPAPWCESNKGKNGIWLRYHWYAGKHSQEDFAQLYGKLSKFRYAYFHVLKAKPDGSLELRKPEIAKRITAEMQAKSANTRAIAWVYIGSSEVNLDKPEVRKNIVAEFRWLVEECGFDGVQVDYEFAPCGARGLLTLLDETRKALAPGKLLSVATPMWYPGTLWGWSDDYFKEIACRCDQLAVMSYDSNLYFPRAYVWLVKQQAIHITRDCAEANPTCKIVLGLPTYDNQTFSHHPYAESLKNALRGVRQGLQDKESKPDQFEGIALFADYTMDASDWKQYELYWLRSED